MSYPYQPPPAAPGGYGDYRMNQPQGLAIGALIAGIIALLGLSIAWIPYLGFIDAIPALVAIVLGIIGLLQVSKGRARGKGMALAGLILGVLALIGTIVLQILMITLFNRGVEGLQSYTSSMSSSYSSSLSASPSTSGSPTSGTPGGQATGSGDAEVTFGTPTISPQLATVEISVKNTGTKQASFSLDLEAVGPDGSVVGTGTAMAPGVAPGASYDSSAIFFADDGKELTGATFRVKSVDTMSFDLNMPSAPSLPNAPAPSPS